METDSRVRTMFTIGKAIRKWCDNRNITIQEFADALDISRESAKRILYGTKSCLNSREIRRLSILMEKPADFFIPNDDELEEDSFIKSLKNRERKSTSVETEIGETHDNNDMDKVLADAMVTINKVTNVEKRKAYMQQINIIARLAEMG